MIRLLSTTLALAVLLAFSPAVRAEDAPAPPPEGAMMHQDKGKGHEMREKWRQMSPEEKAAKRVEMKEKFDKLPPEKQAEIKQRRAERHARRDAMREKMKDAKPEQRHEMREEMHKKQGHGGSESHNAPPQ